MTWLYYALAAVAEISGCFSFWAWLRMGKSPLWLAPGVLWLILFAYLLTKVESDAAGRAYATYGGVYIVASILWLLAGRASGARSLGLVGRRDLRRWRGRHPVWATASLTFEGFQMLQLVVKALISGVLIAVISETAKKLPALGALIASLPLLSVLAMIWLWRDTHDKVRIADHASATFWLVLPSLPMFLVLPYLLKRGVGFWPSLVGVCLMTMALYLIAIWLLKPFGIRL